MYNIFIPQDKGRQKTTTRGFWLSPSGKIYYDYLTIQTKELNNNYEIQKTMDSLKRLYNQEAMFYHNGAKAFCYNSKKNIQEFTEKTSVIIPKKDYKLLTKYIKKYLNLFNGVTVYIDKWSYIIEAWSV